MADEDYDSVFSAGQEKGYEVGYEEGFDAGYKQAKEEAKEYFVDKLSDLTWAIDKY